MQLAYRKYGSGQPLLILHGLFGQGDNWNTLAKRFGEHALEVYAVDLRNHGLSPHSDAFNYYSMADDINDFISEHKLGKVVLLGHSMGGKVAMYFALKYPGMIHKLIIADISPREYEPHHATVLEALHEVDFNKIRTRREAEATLDKHISDPGTKQFLLKNIYWEDTVTNKMNWRFNLPAITHHYHEILAAVPPGSNPVPTLFIRGERSEYITDEDIPGIQSRFPNYTLATVEGAGHWVHAEKPEAFYRVVTEFIQPQAV